MPVDDVADLLDRWRAAGGSFDRARVLHEGMRLLADLSAAERRMLARSLTDRGAPQLAARLEASTGESVDPAQLSRVATGLLSMDEQRLDELVETLRDPQELERLARAAAGQVETPPPATRQRLDELPPPSDADPEWRRPWTTEDERPAGPPGGAAPMADRDADLEDGLEDDLELGGQALDEPGVTEIDLVDADLEEVGIHDLPWEVDHGVERASADEPVPGDANDPIATAEPPATDHERPDADAPAPTPARGVGTALVPVTDDAEEPAPTDVAPTIAGLRAASSATTRFALLTPEALVGVDAAGALAILDAVPPGWQRRRAAYRLLGAGALTAVDIGGLLRRFASPTDAAFVAGALLEAGTVGVDDLIDHLPPATVRRFVVRTGG